MAVFEERKVRIESLGAEIFYLTAGPIDGDLIIFCHGWPAIARTWEPQLKFFAERGYYVVAPDMPGYGRSSAPKEKEFYSLENINSIMALLLHEVDRDAAIWIGHDWGAVAVWSFAAHYPEKTNAVVGLARPYHTLEYGLEEVLKTVNRDVFPADQFPYAQYDYQVHMEQSHDETSAWFDLDPAGILRGVYANGKPDEVGKPGISAVVTRDGGWFGGAKAPPEVLHRIPAQALCISEELLGEVTEAMKRTGFWGANAWYTNHQKNRKYSSGAKDAGYLNMPVLFIGANWDPISDVSISPIAAAQKQYCHKLQEVYLDAGHWVGLEKAVEVNEAIAKWLQSI